MPLKNKRFQCLGFNADVNPSQLPDDIYSSVLNFTFKEATARRVDGYAPAAGVMPGPPDYVIGNRRPGTYYWLYPSADKIYATNQVSHFDITPIEGIEPVSAAFWTGAELNGIIMLNNGRGAPWYWDSNPVNPMLPLPNFPENTLAGWLRAYKYFAFAGNITENETVYENQIYWSASVKPGEPPTDWQPLPSNDAGDNILADTQGSVVDGHQLRDTFILAKNHSLYMASYVGGRFIFNFRKLSESQGVLATNCLVEHQGRMFIFSDGDIIVTDGQQIESIAADRIKRRIFESLNNAEYQKCFAVLHSALDEIWFCYPTGNNLFCNEAAIFNLISQSWGFRALNDVNHIAQGIVLDPDNIDIWEGDNESWEDDNTRWDEGGSSEISDGLIMATNDNLYGVGISDTFDGQPVNAFVEKLTMDFGSPEVNKLISEVWIAVDGVEGDELQVRIGTQKNEKDNIAWSATKPFIIGVDERINFMQTGRYISIHISGLLDRVWSIHEFELRYHDKGRW